MTHYQANFLSFKTEYRIFQVCFQVLLIQNLKYNNCSSDNLTKSLWKQIIIIFTLRKI